MAIAKASCGVGRFASFRTKYLFKISPVSPLSRDKPLWGTTGCGVAMSRALLLVAIQCKEFVSELPLDPLFVTLNALCGKDFKQLCAPKVSRTACSAHIAHDQPLEIHESSLSHTAL